MQRTGDLGHRMQRAGPALRNAWRPHTVPPLTRFGVGSLCVCVCDAVRSLLWRAEPSSGRRSWRLRACLAPFDAIGVVSLSDRELGILKPAWSSDSGTVVVYTLDIRTGTALHSGPGVCEPRDILAKVNFQAKTPASEDFPGYVHRAGLVVCGELTDYVVLAGNQ